MTHAESWKSKQRADFQLAYMRDEPLEWPSHEPDECDHCDLLRKLIRDADNGADHASNIYVATQEFDYEGEQVLGAYSTIDLARAAIDELGSGNYVIRRYRANQPVVNEWFRREGGEWT